MVVPASFFKVRSLLSLAWPGQEQHPDQISLHGCRRDFKKVFLLTPRPELSCFDHFSGCCCCCCCFDLSSPDLLMFRMSKTKGNKIFFSHHATQPLIAAAAAAADKTTSFDQTTFILELNLGVFDRDESRASSMSPSPMPQGTLVAEAFQIEVGCKTGRWWSSLFFKPV